MMRLFAVAIIIGVSSAQPASANDCFLNVPYGQRQYFPHPKPPTFLRAHDGVVVGDLKVDNNFAFTLRGDTTRLKLEPIVPGTCGAFFMRQDKRGARKVTYDPTFLFPRGHTPQLWSAPGEVSVLSYCAFDNQTVYAQMNERGAGTCFDWPDAP